MNTARLFLSSFIILHSSFDIAAAAPPPELTLLRTQYEKVIAEKATAPFDASLVALNTKFTSALDNAIAAAQQAGKLDDILAIQDDKKRLADKLPILDDDDKTPEPLKKLRVIYREQLKRLEDARAAAIASVLPAYQVRLQELETTITKAGRIDEAKELRAYREGLGAALPSATGTSVANTSPPASNAPRPKPLAKVKGDDRKAAQWVLGIGGNVSILHKSSSVKITKPEELPKGSFSLTRVQLNSHFDGYKPITDEDMLALAGLDDLESIALFELPLTDKGLEFAATCPGIKFIETDGIPVTGAVLLHLASLKQLGRLNIANAREFRGGNFEYLKKLPLSDLNVKGTAVNDEDLLVLAKLEKLTKINLLATKVTDDGVAAFKKAMPEVQIIRQ